MLNQDQKTTFCKATAFINSCGDVVKAEEFDFYGICDSVSNVAETRDTLEDFKAGSAKGGIPSNEETPFGKLHIWKGAQPEGAGSKRGDLYVMDFGDARAAYFHS
jgi:hypothetical protein